MGVGHRISFPLMFFTSLPFDHIDFDHIDFDYIDLDHMLFFQVEGVKAISSG